MYGISGPLKSQFMSLRGLYTNDWHKMDDHAVCGAGLAAGFEGALSGQACPTFTDSGQYYTARPAW